MPLGEPYSVGQLLVHTYSKSNRASKIVVKVIKVHDRGTRNHKYYYYDLQYSNGVILPLQAAGMFIPFSLRHEKIQSKIQATTKTLSKHEKDYEASIQLEADAKALFGV